jgi:jumonji domain-containing protein 2
MEIPTFCPSETEFLDFEKYMSFVCRKLDETKRCVGLVRIVPPQSWRDSVLLKPEQIDERLKEYLVKTPVKQKVVKLKNGAFKVTNQVVSGRMSFQQFKAECAVMEKSAECCFKRGAKRDDFETASAVFWREICSSQQRPIYGADSPGSLFSDSLETWNLNNLPSILKVLGTDIAGVTHSYLYFGMWRAMFAAHTEDMELYSINFLHDGAPKMWYAVPPGAVGKFESLAADMFPDEASRCQQFLRHKRFILPPELLDAHKVPYCQGAQHRGEFMVTFPRAYHWGFNSGPNVAEAVNFALDSWIPYGKEAVPCKCVSDSVRIDMEIFLYRYINELRSSGKLPAIPVSPEWQFDCPCGMNVSSEDPEFLWPCKPQFQCDGCDLWVHFECHDVAEVGRTQYCYYCNLDREKRSTKKAKQ